MGTPYKERSWWGRIIGRSVIAILLGNFFEKKTNTASIVALILVLTTCYVVVIKGKLGYMPSLLNIVFVVIGYYFGAKQHTINEEDD